MQYLCSLFAEARYTFQKSRTTPKTGGCCIVLVSQWWIGEESWYKFWCVSFCVQEIICDFVDGLFEMRNDFIKFPVTLEDYKKAIRSFEGKTHLPNVFGAIDGTHWEISKPFGSGSAVDYFSRKQKYTIVNQGACDGNLMFLAVDSGFTGSIHDSRMFDHTWLAEALINNEILQAPIITIEDDVSVKPYLLGDPAYCLSQYIMKPYAFHTKIKLEKEFNWQLSRARVCIERAFGFLKGRWRILLKRIDISPDRASKIFTVCCVLHNILQSQGEGYEDIDFQVESEENEDRMLAKADGEDLRAALARHVNKELNNERL